MITKVVLAFGDSTVNLAKSVLSHIIGAALTATGLAVADVGTEAISGPAHYPITQEMLSTQLPLIMQQRHIVGLSIALIDDQTVVWSQGFGYADKANGIKADGDTIYRADSISKLFTATAAMQLAEQGKLDIDAPIQTYVPNFAIKTRFSGAEPITARLLMTHHSGLPTDYLKGFHSHVSYSRVVQNLQDEYVSYPPKLILNYSNLGASLLGTAIENACGKPFAACLQQSLLRPLGMARAAFAHGESLSPRMSKGYAQGQEALEAVLRDIPAGGLNSSALDLSRFVEMVFAAGLANNQPVLSEASLEEMFRPQNDDVPLDFGGKIGLAWFLSRSPAGELSAFHDGGIGSFNSSLIILPERKLGVVLLSNSAEAEEVINQIAAGALQSMAAEQAGTTPTALQAGDDTVEARASVNDYPGHYAADLGIIQIRRQGKSLSLWVNGKRAPIKRQADGRFHATLPWYGDVALDRVSVSGHSLLTADTPFGPPR